METCDLNQLTAECLLRQTFTAAELVLFQHISETMPAAWQELSLRQRLNLMRALLSAAHLPVAVHIARVGFVDYPESKMVAQMRARLEKAITGQISVLLEQARRALAAGQADQTLERVEQALTLRPDYAPALVLRGEARLVLGHDLQALTDFHTAIRTDDPTISQLARLGAARTLEKRHDYDGALALLQAEPPGKRMDRATRQLYERLIRRQRGEPAVVIRRAKISVMHDTLTSAPVGPCYHGYFAVAVRQVGRPWNINEAEWTQRIMAAGFEFVQVLGSLRNREGDPTLALRLISQPHAHIPERGQLTMALLARVSSDNATACKTLALRLWNALSSILPLAHDHVYGFEPVVDADELRSLLAPFELNSMAEIMRRENVPDSAEDHYAIYPFTPGSINLHNLCWALLRQKSPTMLSIHLLPSDLLPWERSALDQVMLRDQMTAEPIPDSNPIITADPIARWWQGTPRWGQAQANRYLMDSLRAQAYILRVNVATPERRNTLLPDIVASSLFGPLHQVGEMIYGGYDIVWASAPHEITTARRNLTTLDVERWGYSAAPVGAQRLRYLVGEGEAALAFRLPVPTREGVPGVPLLDVKPIAPPTQLSAQGVALGESPVHLGGKALRICQSNDDRRRHTYVVGKTGVGKSTLLKTMALQDMDAGQGVAVIDFHGDLFDDLLLRVPAHRAQDVILFEPADEARPIGLNLLESSSESEKHRIVNEFIGLLMRMYDPHQQGIVGPRFQHNVRNAMLTAMSVEGATLIEVVRALTDQSYVRSILPQVTDPMVRSYWENQIANTSDFHKSEVLDYIVSKFNRFVGDRLVRNIIGQRHTTIHFRQIMDKRQILLVNLSKGKIGPENAQFLGLLLVQRLLLTALSRADMHPENRPDFFLYVDEFQNFATEMFTTVLSEGRKYGLATVVANQYLTQLDHTIRDAIFGNVGSIISFRLGTQDAPVLAPEMYPAFGAEDLLNLPRYTACVKLLIDGVAARPFTLRTLPEMHATDPALAQTIRQTSRMAYGRDVATVTEEVAARFAALQPAEKPFRFGRTA